MNDKQKAISDLLRGADKVIKSGKLDEAMKYINKVFDLDQKNVYAKAYKERIMSLMEAQGISRTEAERITSEAVFVSADPPQIDEKTETIPPLIEQETPVVEKKSAVVPSAPPPDEPKPVIPTKLPLELPKIIIPPQPAPVKKQIEPIATSVGSSSKQFSAIKRTAAALEAYKTLMMEIWRDGSITDEEQSRMESMRETFAITHEEHVQIEIDVRVASYLNAIRIDWRKGSTNFEPLRQKFRISDREQVNLEPKILQLLQSLQSNGSVLILDDDVSFLNVIKQLLEDGGYYCFATVSGEEGLRLLEIMTPDIVLCDINFSKPHMSGFAFYERFRSIDKFLTTPFIFLSALDQEVLVRTGKKLGADDYLTKPVDTEMLLATIEGKLRRSRELRRNFE